MTTTMRGRERERESSSWSRQLSRIDRTEGKWREPEGALGVGGVLKGVKDLLEGHVLAVLLVQRLPYDSVRLSHVTERREMKMREDKDNEDKDEGVAHTPLPSLETIS
jgi:hypothetical protein